MSNKKLNIAIFHLAFIYSGGGERLVLEEAIRLRKMGHRVTCFAPTIDYENCFPELLQKARIKRFIPRIIPSWFPDNALLSILTACIIAPLLFYRFRKYDIYFGANQPGPWIAYLLSKLNNKPYVIYLAQPTRLIHPRLIDQQVGLRLKFGFSMLNVLTAIFKPVISIFDTLSIKHADAVFANGSYAKGLLKEMYAIQVINCPAGCKKQVKISDSIVKERFIGTISLSGLIIRKPYILLTNRNFPHKKFEYALDAFKKIKQNNIQFVITGQETEYTQLLKKIYSADKRIRFVGLLSECDLHSAYKNAAVYVYPAPEEDFGMGIIEAMAYGIPVVAWGNAGPTGIITDGIDGLLAKPFDISHYASLIDKLFIDKALYFKIATAAQNKVQKQFTFGAHTKILDKKIGEYYSSWKKMKRPNRIRKPEHNLLLHSTFICIPKSHPPSSRSNRDYGGTRRTGLKI
jgi:glycosyltransferase involved in cell wall biosynthesis